MVLLRLLVAKKIAPEVLVAKILDEMTVRPISFQRDKRVQTKPRSEHINGTKAKYITSCDDTFVTNILLARGG